MLRKKQLDDENRNGLRVAYISLLKNLRKEMKNKTG